MSIPTYVLGYPPDGSSLGNTKAQIRANLDGTFQTLSVDHQNQNQPNPGYHNVIHMMPNAAPAPIANIGQLLQNVGNDGFATDTTFFFETGLGLLLQLTRNVQPAVIQNGYTFLPGGLVLQWGFVASTAASGTTNFNVAFPNNIFNVSLTAVSSAVTAHANGMYISGAPTTASFGWSQADRASNQTGFFWTAIGF